MVNNNRSRNETAFTVSIEAKEGISTGISAADRARTIAVAIDATHGPDELVSPGHVFPLVAKPGGTLVRAGHTEAGVDISRLAGLNPSAVICEIMRDDGSMARLDDLMDFARTHGLKIGTIRDLIAYRLKKDHMVERAASTAFMSNGGAEWQAQVFRDKATRRGTARAGPRRARRDDAGAGADAQPRPVRRRSWRSEPSFRPAPGLDADDREGRGRRDRRLARGGARLALTLGRSARGQADRGPALRSYGIGAQILAALGIHQMVLLTNTHHSPVALSGYGLEIVEERAIEGAN